MRGRRMGKFKVGDKVIPSKQLNEECKETVWLERVKNKVEDDGYMVISQIYGSDVYMVEGLSSVLFREEWLEPYGENIPKVLSTSIYDYNLLLPLPEDRLSVRDRFAMAALSGMLAHSTRYKPREEGADWHWSIAKEAYELADAMMKRREK